MAEKWLLITSKNKPMVPDQVLQEVEGNAVLTDNGGKVPIESMIKWGYTLTPVRLIETARGKDLLWDDERIRNFATNAAMVDAMKRIRDEYEQERKEKIFIPARFKGSLFSIVMSSRLFLSNLLERVEGKIPTTAEVEGQLEDWKAEVDRCDAILEAILGEDKSTSGQIQ